MLSNYSKRSKPMQGASKQACSLPGQDARKGHPYHGRTCLLAGSLLLFLALSIFPTIARADGGFPVIGVLHAGQRPEGIAVDTQTHMVYIAYEFPSLVVGFDPIRGKVRWSVPAGDSATDVQVDSTNHRVYVISSARDNRTGFFTILDGASGKVLYNASTAFVGDGLA